VPSVSIEERDALERQLACQCPCTLDVFTCRTTDFSCQVSPAMHRDVIALVEGGHSASEILAAFEADYGEQVLMAPKKSGFNWVGWIAPFAALGGGALIIAALIQRWSKRATLVRASAGPAAANASDAELARLAAAVRDDH
jgi:cytochrome c-type biogenesis protein CcmH